MTLAGERLQLNVGLLPLVTQLVSFSLRDEDKVCREQWIGREDTCRKGNVVMAQDRHYCRGFNVWKNVRGKVQ